MAEGIETLRRKIVNDSKKTIGYEESVNKESFLSGVDIGATFTIAAYEEKIEFLERKLQRELEKYDEHYNDLKTLSHIIKKYQDE